MKIDKSLSLENVKPYLLRNSVIRTLSKILFSVPIIFNKDYPDYAYTDGFKIYVGHAFLTEPAPSQAGVILHEILHILLLHCRKSRSEGKDNRLWCYVMEPIVNSVILNIPEIKDHVSLPKGGVTFQSPDFKKALNVKREHEWNTESLYHWALQNNVTPPKEFTLDVVWADETPENQIKEIQMEGLIKGIEPGLTSDELKRALAHNHTVKPFPWDYYLRKHLIYTLTNKAKYDYNRPSRGYLTETTHYEPSVKTKPTLKVGILVDTSGSCFDKKSQDKFASVIEDIRSQLRPSIIVVTGDTVVHQTVKIEPQNRKPLSEIVSEFVGGGGTCYEHAVHELLKHKPNVVVGLTDGFVDNWGNPNKTPFIWLCTSNKKAPFGLTIPVQL